MTPHAYAPVSDNESLQADVMRFMAIIAFCLIAILALVRNVEPAPAAEKEAAEKEAPAVEQKTAEPEVAAAPETTMPAAPQPAAPARSTAEPSSWRQPLPKAEPAPAKTPRTPKPQPRPQRLEAEDVAVQTATTPQLPAPAPAAAAAEEEGLSLRFASDGDFLRLIARGDIRVYAFREADVLTLTSAYDFLQARSPGQLYELMPQTIPSMIVDALVRSRRERGDSDSFSWGITLPAAIQQQISGHVARVASGQLVIDRYGDVHHVASR